MNQGNENQPAIGDMLAEIDSYARGMLRYKWRAVALTWVFCIVGWMSVYAMPDVYEANARVYVDTENALRPLLQGIASSTNVMNEVTIVTREMLSRPNLAAVARETDLDLRASSDEDFQDLLTSLQRRIQITGSHDKIFSIAFQDRDRRKAVAVVDSLVNTFVEKSLGGNRTETSQAQAFLQKQINDYEARLVEAEDKLAEFKRENVAFMPGQGGDYFARLQSSQEAMVTTESKLRLAEERRDELFRQLEGEEPVFGIMPAVPTGQPNGDGFAPAKIRELEMRLEELRLIYTDKHPNIGQILETIELLKKQEEEQRLAVPQGDSGSTASQLNPLDLNPVYQNMRIQLTNTEVEIASLRSELAQRKSEVSEQQRLVNTVPQVEADLSRLNRDYDVVKARYEQLLQRLEAANIGDDAEQSIDEVQFRVIDPPFAGLKPAGPKRQLFLALMTLFAIGAGGALAFLFNVLHPVFFSGRAVATAVNIPVLGAVSMVITPERIRSRRIEKIGLAFALGTLVLSFVVLSVFAERLSPVVRNLHLLVS